MHREVLGSIRVGEVYVYHALCPYQKDGMITYRETDFGTYRIEGIAVAWPSGQQVVVYRGLDGADAGQWLVCSLFDFALKFRAVQQEEPVLLPDPEPPEKVVGHVAESWRTCI